MRTSNRCNDVTYVECSDLKPENVLLGADGHVKLTDFGLSRYTPSPAIASAVGDGSVDGRAHNTAADAVSSSSFCGTEVYMAPEVLLQLGHAAPVDWWTLGIFASELLTGRHPFRGKDHLSTLKVCVAA